MKKVVIIPAVKKNVAFADDLVKKLAGVTLIQRTINKAKEIAGDIDIILITDSDEIRLIGQRNHIQCFYDASLRLSSDHLPAGIRFFLLRIAVKYQWIILLSPYAPLITPQDLMIALKTFEMEKPDLLVPVTKKDRALFDRGNKELIGYLFPNIKQTVLVESRAYALIQSTLIYQKNDIDNIRVLPFEIGHDQIEIESYQDWWICEKLLNRKRVVFRVIGNQQIGMGHIYRSLALAHEITDHEVRFVCDKSSSLVTNRLAGYDYWLGVFEDESIIDEIILLKPDLVINDILNTNAEDIAQLKAHDVRVVNFEDLGSGAANADLVINELYQEPLFEGDSVLWGHEYFFLRDEFNDAIKNRPHNRIETLLITFGGTDPSDLTRKILHAIADFCASKNIKIIIVTGGGYEYIHELEQEIACYATAEVKYYHSTGIMSDVMEQAQLAITSNGRTIYELAHMNIPSIVLSHHAREATHGFAIEENGFIPVGVFRENKSERKVLELLKNIVQNTAIYRTLHENTTKHNFSNNKHKVISRILGLLK